jgi:hypothetical protein
MASAKRWWAGVVVLLVAGASPAWARAEPAASTLADDPTLIALAVALSCADAPEAVEAAPQPPAGLAVAGPEIELAATVRAKTLQFDEVPKVDAVLHGMGRQRTVWKAERVNLPVHPQPGVVYRDVQVRLTISGDLDELSAMLRQAKQASRGIRIVDLAAARAATPAPTATAAPTPSPTAAPAPAPAATAAPTPTAAPTAMPSTTTTTTTSTSASASPSASTNAAGTNSPAGH